MKTIFLAVVIVFSAIAIAMVLAFVPMANAAETANLDLQVTFASSEPLTIMLDPAGPFEVEVGKEVWFTVVAGDPDSTITRLVCLDAPKGSVFYESGPVGGSSLRSIFSWTPHAEDIQDKPRIVTFEAANDAGEVRTVQAQITVKSAPVVSIELNEAAWKLDGVKLGEKRTNLNELGMPIHLVRNTGTVPVLIDIGYASGLIYPEWGPRPGLEQGPDKFITAIEAGVIPPDSRIKVANVEPGNGCPLRLTYGAPTALETVATGGPAKGMGTAYEIRAYLSSDQSVHN